MRMLVVLIAFAVVGARASEDWVLISSEPDFEGKVLALRESPLPRGKSCLSEMHSIAGMLGGEIGEIESQSMASVNISGRKVALIGCNQEFQTVSGYPGVVKILVR